jgi:hypothetical protein
MAADRHVALQQAVDGWAQDVAGGHQAGLNDWQLANVAALNQRARQRMQATGRLSGPELVGGGGNAYRAGDQVITLAPAAGGRLVASQRAVVAAVDTSSRPLPCGQTTALRTALRYFWGPVAAMHTRAVATSSGRTPRSRPGPSGGRMAAFGSCRHEAGNTIVHR